MTAKEHLIRVKRYHDLIQEIRIEIQMMNSTKDGLTGMSFDKELVQTSLTDTGLENQIILIEEKRKKLIQLEGSYHRIREDVQSRIDKLWVEDEQKVLKMRYLDFLEWSVICERMNKTQDAVFSLHRRALNHYIC